MQELVRGLSARRSKMGVAILRVHYSADPDRDPALNPSWVQEERRKYSSQAAWDREQEIVHDAGAGELVFAQILNAYANKIIISDPSFQPSPHWKKLGGYDHGKTNPAGALVAYVDFDGVIYVCREYYSPGEITEHVQHLRELDGFLDTTNVIADPSIFYNTQAQKDGTYKAVASIYAELGIDNLRPSAENNELLGMERILLHWRDLDHREPTLKIVCTEDWSRKSYGVHNDGCPNLLWELKRTRREKMSATLLQRKNPSEAIVDKDNHLRDALKYLVLSLPEPTSKPLEMQLAQRTQGLTDMTNVALTAGKLRDEIAKRAAPVFVGGRAAVRRRQWERATRNRPHF